MERFDGKYPEGFLANELISHDSLQFQYISDLHGFLWEVVRIYNPGASGKLDDYWDAILPTIDTLKAENAKLRSALEIIAGNKQCADNLFSNIDIARAALEDNAKS